MEVQKLNENELFEEQITEERNDTAEDVTEGIYSKNEADRDAELPEDSASEIDQLSAVTKQCIYVSLEHLKPFSGTLYDEKGNKRVISGNPFLVPDNYLDENKRSEEHTSELQSR